MTYTPPPIFITDKQKTVDDPTRIPVCMRQIERWVGNLRIPTGGGGGITTVTSADGTVTVTNPTGPTVDLHVAASSAAYVSLTGPGQTATPGALTQAGGFTVTDLAGSGITLHTSGTMRVEGDTNLYILTNPGGGSSALQIINYGTGGTLINSNSAVDIYAGSGSNMTLHFGGLFILATLPTSAPSTSGALWNNAGVVHVV